MAQQVMLQFARLCHRKTGIHSQIHGETNALKVMQDDLGEVLFRDNVEGNGALEPVGPIYRQFLNNARVR